MKGISVSARRGAQAEARSRHAGLRQDLYRPYVIMDYTAGQGWHDGRTCPTAPSPWSPPPWCSTMPRRSLRA